MARGSVHKTKLHKIHLKQKHVIHLICNENKFMHTRTLMQSLQVLNVFHVTIEKSLCSCIVSKLVVMYQLFLEINLPILPIDIQQNSQETTLHYLIIYITNQNIRYLSEVLHFVVSNDTRLYQMLRKNYEKLLYLKQN